MTDTDLFRLAVLINDFPQMEYAVDEREVRLAFARKFRARFEALYPDLNWEEFETYAVVKAKGE